jgi:hypothetical protein
MHPKRSDVMTFVKQIWTFILIKHQSIHTSIVSWQSEGELESQNHTHVLYESGLDYMSHLCQKKWTEITFSDWYQIPHLLATLFSCDIGSYTVGKGYFFHHDQSKDVAQPMCAIFGE